MNLRHCAAGALVLLLGSHSARADEPKPSAPPAPPRAVPWSDVSARVAKGDAPLFLQVHVDAMGRLALRARPRAADGTWTELGEWSLLGEPQARMHALKGFHAALVKQIGLHAHLPNQRDADGHSLARLLIDATPDALWRSIQWALATASLSQLKIHRLTFLTSAPPGSFDMDLPKDGGLEPAGTEPVPYRDIEVRLFRDNLDKPVSEHLTKIRVGETFTVLLPKGPWPKDREAAEARRREEATVMARVTAAIAAAWAVQDKHPKIAGEIRTPFPKGHAVPYGDVMHVLRAFLEAGIVQVNFEGAAAPLITKEGGGWGMASEPADGVPPAGNRPGAGAPPPGPVAWSDVSARAAQGDAPLFLQVHVGASGRLALRALPRAAGAAWTELGEWSFTGDPRQDMSALRGFHTALLQQIEPQAARPDARDETGHARARLLIDAVPAAPWRHVQWALSTASASQLKIHRLTFLTSVPGEAFDIDLPQDRGGPPPESLESVSKFEVRMVRKGLDAPEALRWTRIRFDHRVLEMGMNGMLPIEPELEEPLPEPETPREAKVVSGGGVEAPRATPDPARGVATVLEFRIEVLPEAEYRLDDRTAEQRRPRSNVWPGPSEEFHAFKELEVRRWLEAQAARRTFVPSKPSYRLVPRRLAPKRLPKDARDFAVVEEPADEAERFDARILARAYVTRGAMGEPVTAFEIKPEYQEAFALWTKRNVGLPMAILRGGEYRIAPYINSELRDHVQVTLGQRDFAEARKEAEELQSLLEAGQTGPADAQPPAPAEATPASPTLDLPRAGAPSAEHAARWKEFEARLRDLAGKAPRRFGEIKTPHPTGGAVPYGDVVGVLRVLLRIGCETVWFEGAAAPLMRKDGGGWGFGR